MINIIYACNLLKALNVVLLLLKAVIVNFLGLHNWSPNIYTIENENQTFKVYQLSFVSVLVRSLMDHEKKARKGKSKASD